MSFWDVSMRLLRKIATVLAVKSPGFWLTMSAAVFQSLISFVSIIQPVLFILQRAAALTWGSTATHPLMKFLLGVQGPYFASTIGTGIMAVVGFFVKGTYGTGRCLFRIYYRAACPNHHSWWCSELPK